MSETLSAILVSLGMANQSLLQSNEREGYLHVPRAHPRKPTVAALRFWLRSSNVFILAQMYKFGSEDEMIDSELPDRKTRARAPMRAPRSILYVFLAFASLLGCLLLRPLQNARAEVVLPKERRLLLFDVYNHEKINIAYRRGDSYFPEAVAQLNHFLRDHRTGDLARIDPRLYDLLSDITAALGRAGTEIDILCGYRTPLSNEILRRTQPGVAVHSLHMLGEAIDIRIPGVSAERLRDVALKLHLGGVGYYPHSKFVHVDLGPVRRWSSSVGSGRR